ncbi:MAG: aminotransferase class I/II-fold pyridoxal phosphate-dependent enzyme [Ruminococcus sp.]|uniref:aminotransferase class I/II-fold pyridoxal phosphate-dependent enzyme n=1 Tax=uncultured Ruminococcus sp. TaxID=165186 RepID=UPI002625A0B6|nr:aminotransferase class I/II-fold pyridoxal phosphate-dependent enzyme [uncultured Ruminococcus sp.]MCR4863073.1 aminotransferase class I/II-fold pyridoxal phosphate-dependent enzyme [Ruminococcus sp.]
MIDYDKVLSDKIKNIKPSGIRKFFDIAGTMENVISLGVGEPDFSTPWVIRKAAIQVLERKHIVYGPNKGIAPLRSAISRRIKKKHGVEYRADDEIIVTVGGSEAIDIALRGLLDPGDEVLVVEPCFVCYAPLVELAGGVPVSVPTRIENNFKLTVEDLEGKITDRTKVLILPFPNNPTGAVMTREDLEPIAELLRGTNIMVLSDEIYSELTYGRTHFSIIELEDMAERTIYVNGFSKAYAMTGWRLGYLAAPAPIVSQISKIHQYGIMCSPYISQNAAVEALDSCDAEIAKMTDEYNVRRKFLVSEFNRLGLSCFDPEGAFYVFPCIKSTGLTSEEFCERLLYEEKVAAVPGSAFGESGEGYMRISYAYSLKHLMEAMKRIEKFIQKLEAEKK